MSTAKCQKRTPEPSQVLIVSNKQHALPRRKLKLNNPTIIAAIITAIATLLAALFNFDPFVNLFAKTPVPTITSLPTQNLATTPTTTVAQTPSGITSPSTVQPNLFIQFLLDNSSSMNQV